MDESFFRSLRSDDYTLLIGRVAMALLFLPSGVEKLLHFDRFVGLLASRTLPFGTHLLFPEVWAILAVATEIAGPLLLLLGSGTRWASVLQALFVIVATVFSHRYWEFEGAAHQAQAINFYKNLAIIGGLLFLRSSGAGAISWQGLRGWRRQHPHSYEATHAM